MKSNEYFLVRIIIIIAAMGCGFLGARIIGSLYYNHLVSKSSAIDNFKNHYQSQIALETDARDLGKMGMTFLRTDQTDLGFECFKKASELEPGWRDAWVWRGYAELKLDPPTGGPKEALVSLKKAENLDPIYPLTYQLLTIAYQQTGDPVSASAAQEKLTYLSKTYQK